MRESYILAHTTSGSSKCDESDAIAVIPLPLAGLVEFCGDIVVDPSADAEQSHEMPCCFKKKLFIVSCVFFFFSLYNSL